MCRGSKSAFSLSFLGLQPRALSPKLQSFISKTYCLSQFTYGLETTYLGAKINNKLNLNEISIEKFKEVQKSVFSLSFLGLQPKS